MAHINLISVADRKDPEGRITKFSFAFPVILRELEKTSHTFEVHDTHLHKIELGELLDLVETMESRIFGISGWAHNYLDIKYLAERIKKTHKDAIVIVGGIIAENYKVVLEKTDVDIVSTGTEGEYILPKLLDCIDEDETKLSEIPGIAMRDPDTGKIRNNPYESLMNKKTFQDQHWPAYEYFNDEIAGYVDHLNTMTDVPIKAFPILTARGCPFACTYCGHLYGSRFLRKTWDRWFDHIEYLIDNHNVPGFYNQDTNMFLTIQDVDAYCEVYRERGSTFEICAEIRPTFGDYDTFKKMVDNGIKVALFGFESGSEKMLTNMKRPMQKMKETRERLKEALRAGMVIYGNFVIGTPGENRKTLRETRRFMVEIAGWAHTQKKEFEKVGKIGTSGYGWTIFLPSPSSELYDLALRDGLIPDEEQYLISLCDEENFGFAKGGKFKVALAQVAKHNVNMSEFTSKQALVSYAHYTLAMARLESKLSIRDFGLENLRNIATLTAQSLGHLVKHYSIVTLDVVRGKEGYSMKSDSLDSGHYMRKKQLRNMAEEVK